MVQCKVDGPSRAQTATVKMWKMEAGTRNGADLYLGRKMSATKEAENSGLAATAYEKLLRRHRFRSFRKDGSDE
jgi:hypothetical protein